MCFVRLEQLMVHIIDLPNAQFATIDKFETQFSLLDNTRPNRPHPARSEENIAMIAESVHEDREESNRRRFSCWALDKLAEDPFFSKKIFITPPDFFLWGYVKSKVYMDKPATIKALEANITRVIGQISLEILERVIENWNLRANI